MNARADLMEWLAPLCNCTLFCHLHKGKCHAHVLASTVWKLFGANCNVATSATATHSCTNDIDESASTWQRDCTVLDVIESTQFTPSGKRSRDVVATHASAGNQPKGNALPSLLPEGLGPDKHLQEALKLMHPFARPPSLPLPVSYALQHQLVDPAACCTQREIMVQLLDKLASLVSRCLRLFAHAFLH